MIITTAHLKEQLNFTDDLGSADDALIDRKIAAAQDHLERLLGYKIEATYGGDDQDPVPPALIEAVSQLAAHWYENRESSLINVTGQQLPLGLWDIVNEYRTWSFC